MGDSTTISILAVIVSLLSYLRARKADHRAGAALLEVKIRGHPKVGDALFGQTRLEILNTGPAIAHAVRVVIWEKPADTKAWRYWGRRFPFHLTKVTHRLGTDKPVKVTVTGSNADVARVWIVWRDASGYHRIHPEPPTKPMVAFV